MGNKNSTSPSNVPTGLPAEVLNDLGFKSINETIVRFESVSLEDVITANSNMKFIANIEKTCYTLDYATLNITKEKIFNQTENAGNYIERPSHSLTGENNMMCLYTYSPDELKRFLDVNKLQKYSFLPITVHAINSASGKRCDMLLIFQNETKQMYWFDSRVHIGYLSVGPNVPRDAIDIMFTILNSFWNIDYTYNPSESWTVAGLFNPVSSLGKFDFLLTTAWCYLLIKLIPHFSSPIELMAALDSMSREDRFNLIYTATCNMTTRHFYATSINKSLTNGHDLDKFDAVRNNDAGTLKQDNYYRLDATNFTKRTANPKEEVSEPSENSELLTSISLEPVSREPSIDIDHDIAFKYAVAESLKTSSAPRETMSSSAYLPGSVPIHDNDDYSHASATELMKLPLRLNYTDSEIDVEKCWENAVKRLANPSYNPLKNIPVRPLPTLEEAERARNNEYMRLYGNYPEHDIRHRNIRPKDEA
jgi:hypothetical protein